MKFAAVLALAALTLSGSLARAQFFTGPAASGAGGAGRAAIDPGEASFLNPAALAHLNAYYISANYGIGHHEVDGDFNQYGVQLADHSEGVAVPGAFSYIRRRQELQNGIGITQQDFQLALGGFALDSLAVGVTGHRQTDVFSTGQEHEQWNGHLGLIYTPVEALGVGLVAYDILPGKDTVPLGTRQITTYALGLNWIVKEMFRMRLDVVRPDRHNVANRNDVGFGIESWMREDFVVRFGHLWKETRDQGFLTAGVGYRGPRLSFNYTFQKDVRVAEGVRHLVDLWLPF